MAFRLGSSTDIPSSIEGTYLIPVGWLSYGLKAENLVLDKKKFDNSLQGSVYRWWEDNRNILPIVKQRLLEGVETNFELWLVYRGAGCVDYFYYPVNGYCDQISSDRIKSGTLYICGLQYLSGKSSNEQKSINSSMIQLFPGCGVTMKYTSWF